MISTLRNRFAFLPAGWGRLLRPAIGLGLAMALAFLAGNYIGHLRYGDTYSTTETASVATTKRLAVPGERNGGVSTEEAMSEWTLATVYSSVRRTEADKSLTASKRRLRLRSVSRISSGEVLPGERITFLTAEAIEDFSGIALPAGSRVEGVIAQATEAGEGAGRLVIEIHSLHAGGRSLTLKALPVAALGGRRIRTQRKAESAGVWLPQLDFRNPLYQAPRWRTSPSPSDFGDADSAPGAVTPGGMEDGFREAIVPQESILEFELLALPGTSPVRVPAIEESQPEAAPTPALRRPSGRWRTARG